jgi:hypothetical protein
MSLVKSNALLGINFCKVFEIHQREIHNESESNGL